MGGRHFVAAKSPKPVLQPGRAKIDNTTPAGPPQAAEPATTSPPANTGSTVANAAHADEKSSSKPAETHPPSHSAHSLPSPSSADHVPIHPTISSKEYKLHHFFSLHRPFLLLNQPTSTIFETVDSSTPLFTSSEDNDSPPSFSTIDGPPEPSPDAHADTARQLAHALVMNRVGGAITWQQALSRLGLGDKYSESNMTLARETAQEWVTIHADSTRRKRRKKMKKHKLKKRRRLTRRQNK